MTTIHEHEHVGACPKRAWTLSVLSDEAPLDERGALPQGLEFHLSRCPSCRALADRVLAIGEALSEWSQSDEPGADFIDRANAHVLGALRTGVAPQGSAEWPDDLLIAGQAQHTRRWLAGARYAAVAAVMVMLVWAARQDAVRSSRSQEAVVQTDRAGPSPAAAPVDGRSDAIADPAEPDPLRTVEAPPPLLGPHPDGSDPVLLPFGPGSDKALERAWLPGRDYGPILLNSVDSESARPSNKPLRDDP
ncbi:MAG: hypothetical protein C4547_07970 [Phycisphaerales bacterium]|nr:MAG: hypothetical protein C4547_07970 [Phycisphaerales bacterium]